ncbi:hypothetical protein [Methylobacterium planeticum]|uniref:Right-handed parallel beta-helix repeat-containing protein n=1 Tax=Methylobacterium planeticum TaxID=2615211 RepID=A0A6N6MN89_9HYPH|nr:hypothetical protein [Methylobacterium planeticum]KAB1070765.1 hypothetical protein F6X51_21575 [Methylobacterium planeticum]
MTRPRHALFLRREVCALVLSAPFAARSAEAPASLLRTVEVESFRREYMTDRQVLQKAFAAWDQRGGGNFVFGANRTYKLGPIEAGAPPFVLNYATDVAIIGNNARLSCDTVASIAPIFLIQNSHRIRVSDLQLQDFGFRPRIDWQGAVLIYVDGSAGPSGEIALTKLKADSAVALFICSGTHPRGRVSRIGLTDVVANDCYYGACFQENGDDVDCTMQASNCRRAYFCYGVTGHRADLSIRGDANSVGSDGCIVVHRYERDTSDVRIGARISGELRWGNLVHFAQSPPAGVTGLVSGVSVSLAVDPAAIDLVDGRDASFIVYDRRGDQPLKTSPAQWRDVRATGIGIGGRKVVPIFDTQAE